MTSNEASGLSADAGLYPIGTVAALTGVSPMTLRAWERRYGLLSPARKPSGHRLYTRADIDRIHRVLALVEGGMRIGQVRAELEAEAFGTAGGPARTVWDAYRRGMIGAIARFDVARLEDVYGDALSLYPIGIVTRELLTPLLVELGERWESQEGSVAEEHFFAFYLRNKLGARFHHHPRESGRRILAACLPGERHEIGLILFALAALQSGLEPIVLGADMPMGELPPAAARASCEAIVLAGSVEPEKGVLPDRLAALVSATGTPVFVGGTTSVSHCNDIVRAGAEVLGSDVGQGLSRLARRLDERTNEKEKSS